MPAERETGARDQPPPLEVLVGSDWQDYELLDSGNGQKLERYGKYVFARPEPQAMWQPALSPQEWQSAHAAFVPTKEESGGHWRFARPVESAWQMRYAGLKFLVQTTPGRHLGVFPEQAVHWDWIGERIRSAGKSVQVLNLFGYTGLASLAAAQAGAQVTHVDASRKAVGWAKENQALSGLQAAPIRWIVDDALKFVQREARRGSRYHGLILDPPKFGRGPKGEVWEFFELFPNLLQSCREVLHTRPVFIVITAYAIRASALCLYYELQEMMAGFGGIISAGELGLAESRGGRVISLAIFSRWQA